MRTFDIKQQPVSVVTVTEFNEWPFAEGSVALHRQFELIDPDGTLCGETALTAYMLYRPPSADAEEYTDCLIVKLSTGAYAVTSPSGLRNFDVNAYNAWMSDRL